MNEPCTIIGRISGSDYKELYCSEYQGKDDDNILLIRLDNEDKIYALINPYPAGINLVEGDNKSETKEIEFTWNCTPCLPTQKTN